MRNVASFITDAFTCKQCFNAGAHPGAPAAAAATLINSF